MSDPEESEGGIDRRRALAYGGLAALLGAAGLGAASRLFDGNERDEVPGSARPTPESTPMGSGTPTAADDGPPPIVARFAPDLHFGRRERWFPTDPRPYARASGDRRVVHGFDALLEYSRERREGGAPPRPTVFYNLVPLDGPVLAIQYWFYSVFDQFTVNFHWHDWELLQVFVDEERGEPLLLSASAHARSCPNNEYLAPDLADDRRPIVLSEVGSHSSATDVNDRRSRFERLAAGPLAPDVTNAFVQPVEGLTAQPFAYGLPRDEGVGLPYVLPELDGHALPDHPALADLTEGDFVDADVTVRDWADLVRPPGDLPRREPGPVITAPGSATSGEATYDLLPLAAAEAAIDDFVGPQLSFEFAIPGFLEDQVADHITTAGVPWEDPRVRDPVGDVTDPDHRRAVGGSVPPGLWDRVVGSVSTLLGRPDGELAGVDASDRAAIEPLVSVSRFPLPLEVAVLLRSDPVATVTSAGVFRFVDIEAGTHDLVVNGPGLAPYGERFVHAGGTARPGVDGRLTLVAVEDATVLRMDRRDSTGIARVRIEEAFAGPVYDARPIEEDRVAVPVHRGGSYTVTVTDRTGVQGAVQVDPDRLAGEPLPPVETGKASLARALASFLAETADLARELTTEPTDDSQRSVPAEFEAAARDAGEAAAAAEAGDAADANELLAVVSERLATVRVLLEERDDYGPAGSQLLSFRARTGESRAEAARETPIAG